MLEFSHRIQKRAIVFRLSVVVLHLFSLSFTLGNSRPASELWRAVGKNDLSWDTWRFRQRVGHLETWDFEWLHAAAKTSNEKTSNSSRVHFPGKSWSRCIFAELQWWPNLHVLTEGHLTGRKFTTHVNTRSKNVGGKRRKIPASRFLTDNYIFSIARQNGIINTGEISKFSKFSVAHLRKTGLAKKAQFCNIWRCAIL